MYYDNFPKNKFHKHCGKAKKTEGNLVTLCIKLLDLLPVVDYLICSLQLPLTQFTNISNGMILFRKFCNFMCRLPSTIGPQSYPPPVILFFKVTSSSIMFWRENSQFMNSMKLVIRLHFIWLKNSFSAINRKCILPNMIRVVPALIIFGKIHFLLTSENEFFMI